MTSTTVAERSRSSPQPITPRTIPVAGPPAAVPKAGAARTRLLLEGPIASTLLRLAAPNVIVNVLLIAVTASVDAYFVGQLGSGALAGLALVFPLLMLMQQMANSSMGGAIASAVARAIGAGRREDAASLVVHALVVAGGMTALFTSGMLFGGHAIYTLMGGQGQVLSAAVEYSSVIFAGAAVYWVLGALTSVVRGTGQPTVLAIVYLAAEMLHIVLVPSLMFGMGPIPPLGITGAGLATVASFAASILVLAWYLGSGRTPLTFSRRNLRLDRRLFADILRVGAPTSLQPVLNSLTLAMLTSFVGTLGPTALAAFGVAIRLEYIQYPLTFGLGAGVLALVGTNVGAGQLARAQRIAWTAAGLAIGFTGVLGLFASAWPTGWTGLFSTSPDVQRAAATYLCIAGLAYPFLGLGLPLSSAFQAGGRTMWPLLATVGRVVVVAAGGWTAVRVLEAGLAGLGIVAACGLMVYGTTLALAFRAGAWRTAA